MVLLTHPLQGSSSVLVAVQVGRRKMIGDQGARVVGLVDGIQAVPELSDC